MKKMVIGILAHVDAGKTTLSESMLYMSGKIRKMGRVDNKDAFLDTYALEKARGITIFSKQALFTIGDLTVTLLDTPGHVDFSAEMERTLQVLDYAILVVSGPSGVQGHTRTLWRLLEIYNIPTFIFVNKMDQSGTDRKAILKGLKNVFGEGIVAFDTPSLHDFYEDLAMCDEMLMTSYIETQAIDNRLIAEAIGSRTVFPCVFGSALKLEGVERFIQVIEKYTEEPSYGEAFGAKIFKISRDEAGNRLTHMKITGGSLRVKTLIQGDGWEEKINQIRLYSGVKFEAVASVDSGAICAVTGLSASRPGEGLGTEASDMLPVLEPVLSYQVILPEGIDAKVMMPKLGLIDEEWPELKFNWDERLQEIHVMVMGEVQLEILTSLIFERFNVEVSFGEESIVYKETIAKRVVGVGHFEPLRHYAEVHLLLSPGEPGSGLIFESSCREEMLARNWQNLVLSHLKAQSHIGVLTGSAITDMRITLIAGKAHNRHTEGGDFREATYRAVRQGLMEAESVLLEPYYEYRLELPTQMVGRAMMDIEKMYGTCEVSDASNDASTLTGRCPVATMRNYQLDVITYTKGEGRLYTTLCGYGPCHDTTEVVEKKGYDPLRDVDHPCDSVFCTQGSGYIVPWHEVKAHMHVDSGLMRKANDQSVEDYRLREQNAGWISIEEIDRIIDSTYKANQGKKTVWMKQKSARDVYQELSRPLPRPKSTDKSYLLVDGYNIIFAWPALKALAEDNMDGAKAKLLDMLSNYQAIKGWEVMVVFDAYKVAGRREEVLKYHNIHVVYTAEAQTADHYIEKFAHMHRDRYHVTVATSDGLQQMIIRGAGASLLSARELLDAIEQSNDKMREDLGREGAKSANTFEDLITEAMKKK